MMYLPLTQRHGVKSVVPDCLTLSLRTCLAQVKVQFMRKEKQSLKIYSITPFFKLFFFLK